MRKPRPAMTSRAATAPARPLTGFAGLATTALAAVLALAAMARCTAPPSRAQDAEFDTALIVSVDVSGSVDAQRYQLQMDGIAAALEDREVIDTILSGPRGGIVVTLVAWSDGLQQVLPWTPVTSREAAQELARRVRALPPYGGEFTCLGRMLGRLADGLVPEIRPRALRVVVDVSGDGPDNCSSREAIGAARDAAVAAGATINGLPILTGDVFRGAMPWFRAPGYPIPPPLGELGSASPEFGPLDLWYHQNVQGGPGSFVLPANGYGDFGRAIRQKFVIEISAMEHPAAVAPAASRPVVTAGR